MDNIIDEYKYEFIDCNEKVLCTIITTTDVDDIIREYRGNCENYSIGYKHPEGGYKTSVIVYKDTDTLPFCIGKRKNNNEYSEPVYASRNLQRKGYSGYTNADTSRVDIRRIIGDIIWSLYIGKIRKGEVKYIEINGEKYDDIRNVRFISKEDKRVEFETYDKDNKRRRILIPIDLDSDGSRLSPNSTKGLYVLVDDDKNLNLMMYKQKTIYQGEEAKTVDLFYGRSNGESGIFFYFKNELKSLYTYGNQEIKISDLKMVFYYNEYEVEGFPDEKESFNIDIFNEGKRSTFIQNMKKQYRKFAKQSVTRWEDFVCKSISEASDEFKFYTKFENESNKSGEEFEYQFELTRISPNHRDLDLKLDTLGKVKKII